MSENKLPWSTKAEDYVNAWTEELIQEYRKKSAEVLGPKYTVHKNLENGNQIRWQPDKDANQQEIIEDWLIRQKIHSIFYDYYDPKGGDNKYWIVGVRHQKIEYTGENKSKSIAFMKAFMSYTKNQ